MTTKAQTEVLATTLIKALSQIDQFKTRDDKSRALQMLMDPQIGIKEQDIEMITAEAKKIVREEPMLLKLDPQPLNICGDIQGQFLELLQIFNSYGSPPQQTYIFLGSLTGRGSNNIETLLYFLCYKIKYPDKIYLLRGQFESTGESKGPSLSEDCKERYSLKLWKIFSDFFRYLPLAALINNKVFCVHGGISPELQSFDQINSINRPYDVPKTGFISDLIWSSPDEQLIGFAEGEADSIGKDDGYLVFGEDSVIKFRDKFNLELIVRSGEVVHDGYEFLTSSRSLVTLFSVPKYQDMFANDGAVMTLSEEGTCRFHLLKHESSPATSTPKKARTKTGKKKPPV